MCYNLYGDIMNSLKLNHISKKDFFKLKEEDVMFTDSELKRAMDKHVSDAGIPLLLRGSTGGEFLLLNATGIGIFSLAIAVCGLLCGVFGVVVVVKKDSLPSLFKTIYGCFVVVWALALAFYFTRYGILV